MEARHYRLDLNNKILSRKTTFYNKTFNMIILKTDFIIVIKNRPNIPVRAIKLNDCLSCIYGVYTPFRLCRKATISSTSSCAQLFAYLIAQHQFHRPVQRRHVTAMEVRCR